MFEQLTIGCGRFSVGPPACPHCGGLPVGNAGPHSCSGLAREIAEAKRLEAIRLLESIGYTVETSQIQDRERMHEQRAGKAPKPLPPKIGTVDDAMAAALQAANNQQPGPIPFAPVIAPAQLPPSLIASTLGPAAAALAANGAFWILTGLGLRPEISFPPS